MIDVAVGVDVGGTKALALLMARDGRVLAEAQAPTPHLHSDHVGTPTADVVTCDTSIRITFAILRHTVALWTAT